ncbi:MAG: hypothetical protein HY401_04755 [Elusimicrobia bacterium]|nr:hypothetical protein [Elusimicrobiota bacterium]
MKSFFYFLPTTYYLLPTTPLHACAVCFGKSDNANLAKAFSYGIFVLLGFTFLILTAFGLTVYNIEKRRANKIGN